MNGRVGVALLCLLCRPIAAAQGPHSDSPAIAEARATFERSQAEYRAGRYALAAEGFQHAYEVMVREHHPNSALVLWNWALCLESVPGRERDAMARLEQFLQEVDPNAPDVRELIDNAQRDLRELRARLGPSSGGGDPPILGIAIGGAGLAAVIAGAITGVTVLMHDDQLAGSCSGALCDPSLRGLAQERQDLAIATDLLMLSGLALSIGGFVIALITELGRGSGARPSASCGPSGCDLAWSGRF